MSKIKTTTASLLTALALSGAAHADTITLGGDDWTGNQARVFIGGGGSASWTIFDDGTTTNESRQQWTWMDVSAALGDIPSGHTVTSATLTYNPGPADQDADDGSSVKYAIFGVPGGDQGRAAVIAAGGAGRDGDDVLDFYAENTGYGEISGVTGTSSEVTFDITALVEGWNNGSLTENPGEMMLLWDSRAGARNWVRWVPSGQDDFFGDAADRPVLTIETVVPEPNSLALLGLGGLLIARRRRG